jgi:DNA transposition AAA+ family ATPase
MLDNIAEKIEDQPIDLREKVKTYVATHSTSLRSVALMAGVGESTLTAWLGGKYRGSNEAVEEKISLWFDSATVLARAKVALPEEKFVMTRTASKILATLEYAQSMPSIVQITGGAGVGKTLALAQHKKSHPNVWMMTAYHSVSTPYAMLEYLRETLGMPETAPHRTCRAIIAKLTGTQSLLVIDECQHLPAKTFDQLRTIYDLAGVGIAFIGNEEVHGRIEGNGRNETYAQVFSRIGKRVKVMKSSPEDIEIMLDAAGIEDAKQRSTLRYIAQRPGALRNMMHVLRLARTVAEGAKEDLSDAHIRAAYANSTGDQEGVL